MMKQFDWIKLVDDCNQSCNTVNNALNNIESNDFNYRSPELNEHKKE